MKHISLIIIAALVGIVVMAGCKESLMQKIDRAKQSAQDEQRGIEQSEPDEGLDYADEWQAFQTEAEEQLAANTKALNELRLGVSKSDDKVSAQIDVLAKTNTSLKKKLDGYRDQGKVNWDAFKRDFSHDLDGLSRALDELRANNG